MWSEVQGCTDGAGGDGVEARGRCAHSGGLLLGSCGEPESHSRRIDLTPDGGQGLGQALTQSSHVGAAWGFARGPRVCAFSHPGHYLCHPETPALEVSLGARTGRHPLQTAHSPSGSRRTQLLRQDSCACVCVRMRACVRACVCVCLVPSVCLAHSRRLISPWDPSSASSQFLGGRPSSSSQEGNHPAIPKLRATSSSKSCIFLKQVCSDLHLPFS